MNKTQNIKNYLLEGNSLTSLEAVKMFDTVRVSAIVCELRHRYGIPIVTDMIPSTTSAPYARYHLSEEDYESYKNTGSFVNAPGIRL